MRDFKDFYVKNDSGTLKVFVKLKPIVFTEDSFSYEGTEIVADGDDWQTETHELTYLDILRMYEKGFHLIEKEEFERAEAILQIKLKAPLEK
jgi:hypothetical protein